MGRERRFGAIMEIEEEFDLPFNNPFKRVNETQTHFNNRCDRSTAGFKRDMYRMLGSGGVYKNYYKREQYSHSAKTQKRAGSGLR